MSESKIEKSAKKILYKQNESSNQVRNKALREIYEQRKTINNNSSSYFKESSYNDTPENNLLARVVDYCLKNDEEAKFKDLDAITAIVRQNLNNTTISVYNNVVISNYLSNFIVQYSKNNTKNPAIINTTKIFLDKYGNVSGESENYIVVKKVNSVKSTEDKTYYYQAEELLSKDTISNMEDVSETDMTPAEKRLYRQMEICQSLLRPVMKKLGMIVVTTANDTNQNNSGIELNNMLTEQDNKSDANNTKKSI